MDFILPHLAVGNFQEALQPPDTIDALLCVAEEKDLTAPSRPYHKVPIVDMQPIPAAQMAEAVLWIRDRIAQQRIMVFCNAGVGRSPSTVVVYLYAVQGFGFGEAVEFVARRKPYMSILPLLIETAEAVRAGLSP